MKVVISWKNFSLKEPTHRVTDIVIDKFSSMVSVTLQKGGEVRVVKFSIECAVRIGFINFQNLINFTEVQS